MRQCASITKKIVELFMLAGVRPHHLGEKVAPFDLRIIFTIREVHNYFNKIVSFGWFLQCFPM